MRSVITFAILFTLGAAMVPGQEVDLKGYEITDGLKVEIAAKEPVVVNPVAMTFAEDGSLYVVEWVSPGAKKMTRETITITYKDGKKRSIPVLKKTVKDRIKKLIDTNDDGIFDKGEVVLEDDMPSGVLFHEGYLYLTGHGTVRRHKQYENGLFAKKPQIIAQGFGGVGHRQVSGIIIGNDGWLYITCGAGGNDVEGSDGSRAKAWDTGAVFRCRTDGSKMHVFAIGFLNPYGNPAMDANGRLFLVDNDSDHGKKYAGCRLIHAVEGGDYGWRSLSVQKPDYPDVYRTALFGGSPGKMKPVAKLGRGAPSGIFFNGAKDFRIGPFVVADVVRQSVRRLSLKRSGSAFSVSRDTVLMKSIDPRFRPCQVVTGPDDATYVCDWRSDPSGPGKWWGNGKTGRIYRLYWDGAKLRPLDTWKKYRRLDDKKLSEMLKERYPVDRLWAQKEMVRRAAKLRKPLLAFLHDELEAQYVRVAAIDALQQMWNDDVAKAFRMRLQDSDSLIRRKSAMALGLNATKGDRKAHEALVQYLFTSDKLVRRAVYLAIGKIGAPGAADALVNALKFDDGKDLNLRDGLVRAIEQLGKNGVAALLQLSDSGERNELEQVRDAFLALRIAPGVKALGQLLKNYHLTAQDKSLLIQSLTNYTFESPPNLDSFLKSAEQSIFKVKKVEGQLLLKTALLSALRAVEIQKSSSAHQLLARFLDDKSEKVRDATIDVLGRTPEGAKVIVTRYLTGKLPKSTSPHIIAVLRRYAGSSKEHAELLRLVME